MNHRFKLELELKYISSEYTPLKIQTTANMAIHSALHPTQTGVGCLAAAAELVELGGHRLDLGGGLGELLPQRGHLAPQLRRVPVVALPGGDGLSRGDAAAAQLMVCAVKRDYTIQITEGKPHRRVNEATMWLYTVSQC